MGHTSRFSGLLYVEASRTKVSQSSLKTGGGAAWMVRVTSSWRLREDQVENEQVDVMSYVGPYYPCFIIFFVLDHMGNLVFCLGHK
jgi:hypothetical protein